MNIGKKKSVLSPVKLSLTAADQVQKKLILAIGLKELKSGERVTEIGLAEILNVSRVPVREAMQRLLTFGVLQTGEGPGMRISNYGERRVRDLMEIRKAVERIMFDRVLSLTDSKEELIENLQEIVHHMAMVATDVDTVELSSIDLEFHRTIAYYSNNSIAKKVWEGLAPHLMIVFCGNLSILSKRSGEVQDHQNLIKFIENGDHRNIDVVLNEHFSTVWSNSTFT